MSVVDVVENRIAAWPQTIEMGKVLYSELAMGNTKIPAVWSVVENLELENVNLKRGMPNYFLDEAIECTIRRMSPNVVRINIDQINRYAIYFNLLLTLISAGNMTEYDWLESDEAMRLTMIEELKIELKSEEANPSWEFWKNDKYREFPDSLID